MTVVVVNHLRFRDPVDEVTLEGLREPATLSVDAGALAARVLQVDERHLVLLLDFASAEDASRIAKEVGGPWMREHIVPLLTDGTDRAVGTVVAAVSR